MYGKEFTALKTDSILHKIAAYKQWRYSNDNSEWLNAVLTFI